MNTYRVSFLDGRDSTIRADRAVMGGGARHLHFDLLDGEGKVKECVATFVIANIIGYANMEYTGPNDTRQGVDEE